MNRRIFVQRAVAVLAGGVLSACVYGPRPGGGPPPWAPAHGYRRKHPSGATLVYDAGLGVYVVAGMPGYYYADDRFYRIVDGGWYAAGDVNGPWHGSGTHGLPPGLAKKQGRGGPPGHGKHR